MFLVGRSQKALALIVGVFAFAVAATTAGYFAMSKKVTLSLDGHHETVRTLDSTVGQLLADRHVSVGDHDAVAPGMASPLSNGGVVAVRFGRPLDVRIDGDQTRYWVTAGNVQAALSQLGLHLDGDSLSTSRSAGIGRDGLVLSVVTPKSLVVKIAGQPARHLTLVALTVAQALKQLGVHVDASDRTSPGLGATLTDGDRIVFTKVRVVTRAVTEAVDYDVIKRPDKSMYADQSRTIRPGDLGSRHVVYRITYVNGHVAHKRALEVTVLRPAVAEIERVGTKARPVVFASGNTVWDKLAQCESGGNWADNTGNGYYGGLQFSLATWRAYGGTGLPSNASRATQIKIATKLRNASGGYGAWPACSAKLGLPR